MARFCGKCGSMLNVQTGKCPVCDKEVKIEIPAEVNNTVLNPQPIADKNSKKDTPKANKAKKVNNKKEKKSGKAWIAVVVIAVLLILATAGSVGVLVYNNILDIPFVNDVFYTLGIKDEDSSDTTPQGDESSDIKDDDNIDATAAPEEEVDLSVNYEVPEFDAEKYFSENTTLLNSFAVSSSTTVSTESDAYKHFEERGFVGGIITYDYTIDGEYLGDTEVSRYSSDKHPMYRTYYTSATGELWIIDEVNGSFFATPFTYNYAEEGKLPVLISESDSITSYDSGTDAYYVNIPDNTQASVKKIAKIDSKTLDTLTSEGIDKL